MIVGETMAVVSVLLSTFIPGVPSWAKQLGIPVAILFGASALLLVAIFDKLDPTRPTILVGTDPDMPEGLPDGSVYVQREK